jgi:hypothetical protein
MKKFIILFLVLAVSIYAYGQPVTSASVNKYISYMQNAKITQNDLYGLGLPKIAGTWYFVDVASGNDSYNGMTVEKPFLTVAKAYATCTTGRGDGIVLLSRTISGTTYSFTISTRLLWAKYGITVVGIASPNVYFGRARISHAAASDSMASLMLLSGQNNTFINVDWYNNPENDGAPVSATAQVSAVQVSGARNTFISNHFNCTPQSANAYKCDLELRAGSDEGRYIDCIFGSSSFDIGNNASSWVYIGGAAAQHWFKGCTFLQRVSAGTAFGGIECGGATYLNGVDIYEDCNFAAWRANTSQAGMLTSFFIGTKPNTGYILMRDCILAGFNLLDSASGNDCVFSNQPTANSAGGIAVTP